VAGGIFAAMYAGIIPPINPTIIVSVNVDVNCCMVISGCAIMVMEVAPLLICSPFVDSMCAPITPRFNPIIPPIMLMVNASAIINVITCLFVNPTAFITPISLVLSITEVIIVAIIPATATASADVDVA